MREAAACQFPLKACSGPGEQPMRLLWPVLSAGLLRKNCPQGSLSA